MRWSNQCMLGTKIPTIPVINLRYEQYFCGFTWILPWKVSTTCITVDHTVDPLETDPPKYPGRYNPTNHQPTRGLGGLGLLNLSLFPDRGNLPAVHVWWYRSYQPIFTYQCGYQPMNTREYSLSHQCGKLIFKWISNSISIYIKKLNP